MAVLGAFAAKHTIGYPLLSDEGSHVIRRLGLINERVQEDHAAYGIKPDPRHTNLPYPGIFALDASGVIVSRRFHESYRERDGGASLLAQSLGILDPAPDQAEGSPGQPVVVRAWLDSPTYSFFQRLHVHVELRPGPGVSVATPPTVRVSEIPGVEVGAVTWPPVPGAMIRGLLPLTFTAPPGAGDVTVELSVGYQASSDAGRLPPASFTTRLAIKEVAMLERTLPPKAAV